MIGINFAEALSRKISGCAHGRHQIECASIPCLRPTLLSEAGRLVLGRVPCGARGGCSGAVNLKVGSGRCAQRRQVPQRRSPRLRAACWPPGTPFGALGQRRQLPRLADFKWAPTTAPWPSPPLPGHPQSDRGWEAARTTPAYTGAGGDHPARDGQAHTGGLTGKLH